MAATQVATQVTTKRLFNIMSTGQALMRSVYYSRQTSSKFLWQKQKEIFSIVGSVSRRWSSTSSGSVAEGATQDEDSTDSAAPPAVDADTKSYGTVQEDHQQVASSAHDEHSSKGDDQERLSDTSFDMSKVSKPSGDE
jgi:hypothetical protein